MLALNRLLTDDFDLQFTPSTKAKPIETIPDPSKLGGQMNGFFSSFEGGTICGSIRRALSKEYESQFDRIEIASATRNAHCDHLAKSITTTAVKVLNRLISLQGETTPEGLFARKLLGRTHFTLRDFYREIMLVLAADHSTWIELRNLIQLPRRDNGKNIRKTKWEGDFENRVRQILSNLPETGTSLGADAWLEHLDWKQLKECFKKEEAGFIRQDDKIAEAKSRELDEKRKRREARKRAKKLMKDPDLGGVLAHVLEMADTVHLGGIDRLSLQGWEDQLLDNLAEKATTLWSNTGASKLVKAFSSLLAVDVDRVLSSNQRMRKLSPRERTNLLENASLYLLDLSLDFRNDRDVKTAARAHLRSVAPGTPRAVTSATIDAMLKIARFLQGNLQGWDRPGRAKTLSSLLRDASWKVPEEEEEEEEEGRDKPTRVQEDQFAAFARLACLVSALEQGYPLRNDCEASSAAALLPIVGKVRLNDGRPDFREPTIFRDAPSIVLASWKNFARASRGIHGHALPSFSYPTFLKERISKPFDLVEFGEMLDLREFHRSKIGEVGVTGLDARHANYATVFADVDPLRPPQSMQWIGQDLHSESHKWLSRTTADLILTSQSSLRIFDDPKEAMDFAHILQRT